MYKLTCPHKLIGMILSSSLTSTHKHERMRGLGLALVNLRHVAVCVEHAWTLVLLSGFVANNISDKTEFCQVGTGGSLTSSNPESFPNLSEPHSTTPLPEPEGL